VQSHTDHLSAEIDPPVIQPSLENILEEAFKHSQTSTNTFNPLMEELFTAEEIATIATHQPMVDRQMLDKFFN